MSTQKPEKLSIPLKFEKGFKQLLIPVESGLKRSLKRLKIIVEN